jgi:hypothetical protein
MGGVLQGHGHTDHHHDRDFNAIARVVPLRIHPESMAG